MTFNIIDRISALFLFLMFAANFIIYALICVTFSKYYLSGLFTDTFSLGICWLCVLVCVGQTVLFEILFSSYGRMVKFLKGDE